MVVLAGQTQLLGSLPLQEKIPAAVQGSEFLHLCFILVLSGLW